MSYHVQQNTQQKTFGLFIVFAFHVVLIWGFMNGLGANITKVLTPDPIATTVIDKPKPPVTPPKPDDPVIIKSTIDFTLPQPVDPNDFINPPTIKDGPIDIGDGPIDFTTSTTEFTKPSIKKASKPKYPSASSLLGEEGTTGLKLFIAADGHVADAQIASSSGFTRLDTAALQHAMRNWTFNPCTENGKPIACWHQTKLKWKLEDAMR